MRTVAEEAVALQEVVEEVQEVVVEEEVLKGERGIIILNNIL